MARYTATREEQKAMLESMAAELNNLVSEYQSRQSPNQPASMHGSDRIDMVLQVDGKTMMRTQG